MTVERILLCDRRLTASGRYPEASPRRRFRHPKLPGSCAAFVRCIHRTSHASESVIGTPWGRAIIFMRGCRRRVYNRALTKIIVSNFRFSEMAVRAYTAGVAMCWRPRPQGSSKETAMDNDSGDFIWIRVVRHDLG